MPAAYDEDPPRVRSGITPKAVKGGASAIEGRGVHAAEAITAGEVVAVKGGHIIDGATVAGLPEAIRDSAFPIAADCFLAARAPGEYGGVLMRINHSCAPNLGIGGNVLLVALRDVAAGEELTIDYALFLGDPDFTMACRCQTPACRGMVTGTDWMRPDVQARYPGWFSWWLQQKITQPRTPAGSPAQLTFRDQSRSRLTRAERRSERVWPADGDGDTACTTDVMHPAGSFPAARTTGEKNTIARLDCPGVAFTGQELHAARRQPGSVTSAAPGSWPRAASAASCASTMLCACRWVAAWPSTAVRKGSLASRYTVAPVCAMTLAVRGTARESAISPTPSPRPQRRRNRPSWTTSSCPAAIA